MIAVALSKCVMIAVLNLARPMSGYKLADSQVEITTTISRTAVRKTGISQYHGIQIKGSVKPVEHHEHMIP